MKSKKKKPKKDFAHLVKSIGTIAKSMQTLARKAEKQYAIEVESIIRSKDRDSHRIKHVLDDMLDFCFDAGVLGLYKKLCRYYFDIAPEATVDYIYAYREMWDQESLKQNKGKKSKSLQSAIINNF